MKAVDNYLMQNGTQQEIEQGLMAICAKVPIEQLSQDCKKVVSENFVMIYDELLAIIGNADVVCSAIGLCSSSLMTDDNINDLVKRLPDLVKEALENNELPKAVPFLTIKHPSDKEPLMNKDCSDCQAFVKKVQTAITTDGTIKTKWTKLIESECKMLGPGIDELCSQTVADAMSILSELNGPDDVNSICDAIMMCGMGNTQALVTSDNDMCSDCKNFMDDWKNIIMHNKTIINKIVTKLAGLYCLQKPNYMRKQCTRYVAMVFETALNQVAHESSEEICEQIYFCDAQTGVKELTTSDEGVSSDKYCTDCTQFMTDLQSVAKNNASIISDITDLVKEQCDALGPDIADLCKQQIPKLVQSYLPIFGFLDVNLICSTILMCPAGGSNMPKPGDLCNDCIAFTQDWQAIAANNKSIISNLLNFVKSLYCDQMPPSLQAQCYQYAGKLKNQGIADLSKFDAETICSTVYLCLDKDETKNVENTVDVIEMEKLPEAEGVSDTGYCKDCTTFMKDLQGVAKNNQTIIDDLTNLIKEQCDSLGIGISEVDFVHKCKAEVPNLITNYLPQFEVIDVNLICSTILMCPSGSSMTPTAGDLCNDCVAFTKDWQMIIQNNKSIITELVQKIDTIVCAQIPEFLQGECHNAIQTAETNVINTLNTKDAMTICGTMYMCMSTEKPQDTAVINVQQSIRSSMEVVEDQKSTDIVTCALCKIVIHELDKMLQGNTTEAAVVAALDKVCSFLSEDISEECKKFVNTYGEEVIDMIINEVESGLICTKIALCSAAEKVNKVSDNTACELCEVIATELDNLLTENSTEDDIITAVEKVCSILPSADQDACKLLIEQYGKEIINYLAKQLSPKTLCSDLGLCTSSVAKKGSQDSAVCEICEIVAEELDHLLSGKSTEKEIIDAVEKVCDILPSKYKKECDTLIQTYGDEIIQLLVKFVSPKALCMTLKLCPSAQVKVSASATCEICEAVASELEKVVTENSTENEIIDAVKQICKALPDSIKQECSELIDMYGAQIINLLIGKVPPEKICSSLGLCTGVKVSASTTCEICEAVDSELEKVVTENSTEVISTSLCFVDFLF
uniref:Pulmonary surfactant-associated protein B n=1 Tax=Phallusia mammillata TaxID=59560 RepID=A0A6F9DH12_9ASCI|nr:uncharacterized protein LOC100176110 [Phallusia mammillata]